MNSFLFHYNYFITIIIVIKKKQVTIELPNQV